MNREKIKKKLLETMCFVAENADFFRGAGIEAENIQFKPFKPGVADKWHFKKIVEDILESLEGEMKTMRLKKKIPDLIMYATSLINLTYARDYLPDEEKVLDKREADRRMEIAVIVAYDDYIACKVGRGVER